MHKFLKNFYYIITAISLIFFLKINYIFADETLIGLNASAKHYCTCLFISNMEQEYCDTSYDLIMSASTNNDLFKQIKMLGYEANFEKIDTTNKSIEDVVQKYTFMLEQEIKKYPEQYFWVHKRWKTKKI